MSPKNRICLTAMLLLFACSGAMATQNSPAVMQQVIDAARDGLSIYLQKIPAGLEKNYGFSDRKEFERATLGRPYHQVLMDAVDGSVEVVGTWRVPILVDGRSQALLTVAKQKGAWKVVEIGAAQLAGELGLPGHSPGPDPDRIGSVPSHALGPDFFGPEKPAEILVCPAQELAGPEAK